MIMLTPPFIINGEFIASQGTLCGIYHQQQKRQRIVKKVEGKLRRGDLLTNCDLRQIKQYGISI